MDDGTGTILLRSVLRGTALTALLPSWVTGGGGDAVLDRLRDDAVIAELERSFAEPPVAERIDWSTIRIAQVSHPDLRELVGRSIADLAAEAGQSPLTVVSDTLIADRLTTLVDTRA
ncbi:hypothetical protein [Plantibacter sp. ME-Dv--P-095]|uniref:hypothetical protein n=1 Tax=Plantibacter sp. ME-Dv--P-095 TaxID=3040299 RepID=UPI00254DDABC|nr:hypothetical protein [Plantibacter sp. ME-Dv--P-095]